MGDRPIILTVLILTAIVAGATKVLQRAHSSFLAGETSPLMAGRSDSETGCREIENAMVVDVGQVTRRPGSVYVVSGEVAKEADSLQRYPVLQELDADEIPDPCTIPDDIPLSGAIAVTDAAGLQAMVPGNHYVLQADIDMTGVAWTGLYFNSSSDTVIEGNSHTISNLTITAHPWGGTGFIAYVGGGGDFHVRNLTLSNCAATGTSSSAVFLGQLLVDAYSNTNMLFKNITVTGCSLTQTSGDYAGALFGHMSVWDSMYVSNCTVTNCSVTTTADCLGVGGMIGAIDTHVPGNVAIQDCTVSGATVTATAADIHAVGGVVGQSLEFNMSSLTDNQCPTWQNCTGSGNVVINASASNTDVECVAGFASNVVGAEFISCTADFDITFNSNGAATNDANFVGGFVGATSCYERYTQCSAAGTITFTDNGDTWTIGEVGGFGGETKTAPTLHCESTVELVFSSDMDDLHCVGGFIGCQVSYEDGDYPIQRCCATGDITVTGDVSTQMDRIGGFIGEYFDSDAYDCNILNCYTWSSITATGSYPADAEIAGFLGDWENLQALTITNCYCAQTDTAEGSGYTNQIPTSTDANGFGADGTGVPTVTASYFDYETSGITTDDIAEANTTDWLQTKSNFIAAGWDFNDIWYIPDDANTAITDFGPGIRLEPFIYSETDTYVMAFGHKTLMFFRDTGYILDANDPNYVYALATPYDGNDVFELQIYQSKDVCYITHPDYSPRKLQRNLVVVSE